MNKLHPNVKPKYVAKKYEDTVFYYVSYDKGGGAKVKPCKLEADDYEYMIRTFDKDWNLDIGMFHFRWENLFTDSEDAKQYANQINQLYDSFRHKPYVAYSILKEHEDVFINIENLVNKLLDGFENYDGIDFCDVGANGIQIRIHHKMIKGYTYGKQHTILYDFSNTMDGGIEMALTVVKEFLVNDDDDSIRHELNMIADGEKYGWN